MSSSDYAIGPLLLSSKSGSELVRDQQLRKSLSHSLLDALPSLPFSQGLKLISDEVQ